MPGDYKQYMPAREQSGIGGVDCLSMISEDRKEAKGIQPFSSIMMTLHS